VHIHLDAVGGVAGDMFVAALLDAWPELIDTTVATVHSFWQSQEINLAVDAADDGILTGSRFRVSLAGSEANDPVAGSRPQVNCLEDTSKNSEHAHTHWIDIRERIEGSDLNSGVKRHALGIFSELAKAEATVHGTALDDVTFHEVGNWDSIADILAAATIIESLAVETWSISSLPIGSGFVSTAHGQLAIPAPATCLLLKGFLCHDDGRPGERVTPTGAAIIRYLQPASTIGAQPRILGRCGMGFGTRLLTGMSNVLRAIEFESTVETAVNKDSVAVLQFDIDDQTGEELAVALDCIRANQQVIDVSQSAVFGKKNRLMSRIQILTKPSSAEAICDLCFEAEQSTLAEMEEK